MHLLVVLGVIGCLGALGVAQQPGWHQIGSSIVGEADDDRSGASVSMSADGTVVAIGAPGIGHIRGYVRVYEWSSTQWIQRGEDLNGEAIGDQYGRSVSMSADGVVVAIGAMYNDENGTSTGHVRVFKWDSTRWTQQGGNIIGEAEYDRSGGSVSLSANGTVVAIGAHRNDGANGTLSGHVRVFEWNSAAWVQRGRDIDGEAELDSSGGSVSLASDGTVVAIGAQNNYGVNGPLSGHVRIYEWKSETWVQRGRDIDGEAPNDYSGKSVSLSSDGTVVAIGAYSNDGVNGSSPSSGHTRVYEWNSVEWVQRGGDIDGETSGDQSGNSVSISADGTIVAISAQFNAGNGRDSGHVRIYEWNSLKWIQRGEDIEGETESDRFGSSVSLSADGSIVAIGAQFNTINGTQNGITKIFKYESALSATTSVPETTSTSTASTTSPPDTTLITTTASSTSVPATTTTTTTQSTTTTVTTTATTSAPLADPEDKNNILVIAISVVGGVIVVGVGVFFLVHYLCPRAGAY